MTVAIDGYLVRDAEKRTAAVSNHAVVTLVVHVGPGYHAEVKLPYRGDHPRAEAVARAARRGAQIRVTAAGLFPRVDHSHAAIVLTDAVDATINGTQVYP